MTWKQKQDDLKTSSGRFRWKVWNKPHADTIL